MKQELERHIETLTKEKETALSKIKEESFIILYNFVIIC
jgi:hypothetical protein